MPKMDEVYAALLKADAAGDTESAKILADYIRGSRASADEMMAGVRPEYTTGEAFSKGVKRGFKQMGSALGDVVPAMVGSAFGAEDYAKGQMQEAADTQAEIQRDMPAEFTSYKQVDSPGKAVRYFAETAGEQFPNILTSLIPGVGAGAIAGRTAASAAGKALLAQAAERGLAGEAAEQFVASGLKAAAPQIAAKAGTAQNVGVYLGAYAQNAPEIFQNVYEQTGSMRPAVALLYGSVSSALDSVLPARLIGTVTGPMKVGIIEKILEKSGMNRGLLRKVTSEGLTSTGAEGLTEGAQEAIGMAAENFVDANKGLFNSEGWNRIMESAVKGAVAGGAFGGVGGVAEGVRERGDIRAEADQKQAEADQKQAEADQKQAEAQPVVAEQAAEQVAPPPVAEQERPVPAQSRSLLVEAVQKGLKGDDIIKYVRDNIGATQPPVEEGAKAPEAAATQEAEPVPSTTAITDDLLKSFGVGPTALIRKNKLLEGKDVANPEDAAEVKRVLEAYAENRSEPIRNKIEQFLARPEFTAKAEETNVSADTGPIAGASESELQSTELPGGQPSGTAGFTTESVAGPVAGAVPAAVSTDAGEAVQPGALAPEVQAATELLAAVNAGGIPLNPAKVNKIATDLGLDVKKSAKPEDTISRIREAVSRTAPTKVEAAPTKKEAAPVVEAAPAAPVDKSVADEATAFSDQIDKRVDAVLNKRYETLAANANIPRGARQTPMMGAHRGTEAHSLLKLPALINKYLQYRRNVEAETNPKLRAKAIMQSEAILAEIDKLGVMDALGLAATLRNATQDRLNKLPSRINKQAMDLFDETARSMLGEISAARTKSRQTYGPSPVESFPERTWFAPETKSTPLDEAGKKAVASGDVRTVLKYLTNNASPVAAAVLRKINSLNLTTKIVLGKVRDGSAGEYDSTTNTITLDPNLGLNAYTLTHELVHAAIANVLDKPNHPLTKEFTGFFNQIQARLGNAYGAQNLQEFAAELVSNPEFQAVLKGIKAPKSESLFKRIVQSIAEFLGFRKGQPAFDAGLKFVNDALDISGDVEPSDGLKLYAGIDGVEPLRSTQKKMPSMTAEAVEKAKNYASTLGPEGGGLLKAFFGLLRLDNLNKMYGNTLTSIRPLLNAIEQRNGMRSQRQSATSRNVAKFSKVQKNNAPAFDRMSQMAIDARLAQIDLKDANFKPTAEQQKEYARLTSIYKALPKEVREVYDTMRADFDREFDEYKKFLMDNVGDNATLRQKIKTEFEARSKAIGYVPFMRYGDYWIEHPDPKTGERVAAAFESPRERQQYIDKLSGVKPGEIKTYTDIKNLSYNSSDVPPSTFVGQIMAGLKAKGASQEMLNEVYQSYMLLFPGESIVKQMVKSKNVAGMSKDLIRGYESLMNRWASKFANSKYNPEIAKALEEIKEQGIQSKDAGVNAAAATIVNQRNFFLSPDFNSLTKAATSFSYFEYIAGNISSAIVNLTSLPMLVWPMLAGTYGFAKAKAAMTNAAAVAIKDSGNAWGKDPKYAALYAAMMDHGQLKDVTANDILGAADSLHTKMLKAISIPFSASEQYNRAVTAIAAYNLAIKNGVDGKKVSQQEAIQHALDMTKDAHTSGMVDTAPRWMQQGIGRVFFTFKSYAWNSAFIIARAWHKAFKGESPEVRAAARRQLIGTYGMAMAFAGTKGLPFMGAASVMGTMLNALLGDDDEPFDFDEFSRDLTGDLLHKGAFNYLTNIELANRTAVAADLVFRDDPRGVAEHGYTLSAMQQMFGPMGTYVFNAERSIKAMNEGHIARGIEGMLPSWARNGLKGGRYMFEGATTLKGDPIDEDVSAWNSAWQLIGFAPADLSLTYEKLQTAKGYEREKLQARTKILNLYEMARMSGDPELMDEVRERVASYNPTVPPKLRVTSDSFRRSIAARKRAEQDMINGVRFNRNLRPDIQKKIFEDEDEE